MEIDDINRILNRIKATIEVEPQPSPIYVSSRFYNRLMVSQLARRGDRRRFRKAKRYLMRKGRLVKDVLGRVCW